MLKADLHIHTTASDGKLTPLQIVSHALERKLDVIAITDHDTTAGVAEAIKAAEDTPLRVIQGAEISTLFEGRECHLLAYAFEDNSILQEFFRDQKQRRRERAKAIVANLNKIGFDLSYDEVRGEAGSASIGRPHIARVMIKKGYASDMREVFLRYLSNGASACHHVEYPGIYEAMRMIHRAGGYAVLAHPADSVTFIDIKKLKDNGMDGIECYHPSHNTYHQRRYVSCCENYNLMATGGSDFHGSARDFYHLGVIYRNLEPESPLLKASDGLRSGKTVNYSEMACK